MNEGLRNHGMNKSGKNSFKESIPLEMPNTESTPSVREASSETQPLLDDVVSLDSESESNNPVLPDGEYLQQQRKDQRRSPYKKPEVSGLPVLEDVVSEPVVLTEVVEPGSPEKGDGGIVPPTASSKVVSDELMTRVKGPKENVRAHVRVPDIVLTALRQQEERQNRDTKVRVLEDGSIELIHTNGEIRNISYEEALKRVSLSVNPELATYKQPEPSLADPVIEQSFNSAAVWNREQLSLLNKEIANRVSTEEASSPQPKPRKVQTPYPHKGSHYLNDEGEIVTPQEKKLSAMRTRLKKNANLSSSDSGNPDEVTLDSQSVGASASELLRIEHTQEIFDPIVGKTADRLQRKSDVLHALSEDVEDAKIIESGARGKISALEQSEKIPKPKLTHEEMRAYLARVRSGSKEETGPVSNSNGRDSSTQRNVVDSTQNNELKKPHLNNAESIAYLKDVQEKRKQQREVLDQFQPEIGSPIPEETMENDIDVKLPLEEGDVDILLPFGKEVQGVDIFLPLSEKVPVVRERPIPAESLVSTKPSVEDIKNDISYLEKVKSEVSSGSREFIEFAKKRDPEFKKAYESAGGEREALTYMWIERKLQELKSEQRNPEQGRSGNEQPTFFDNRFETKFGITRDELSKIKGFDELSKGQQMLVYENLNEYAEQDTKGYLSMVWAGIMGPHDNKNENLSPKGTHGIDNYRDVLAKLINNAETYGPKVHMENGVAMPDLVGMEYKQAYRREQYALNKAAHVFAHIPESWQKEPGTPLAALSGLSRRIEAFNRHIEEKVFRRKGRLQYREYVEKQKAFEESKKNFARVLEVTGMPQGEIVKKLIDIDAQVHAIRFIETNPEAVAALQSVDDEDMWKRIGATLATGPLSGGFGTVGRAATAHALKDMNNPFVSKLLSDLNRWNPRAAEQRERDRRTQMGRVNQSDRVPKVTAARQEVQTPEGIKDMGVTAKLERLAGQLDSLPPIEECTKEQMSERARLLKQLKELTMYSYDELKLKHIQFGNKDEVVVNVTNFFETLALAQTILAREELGSKATSLRRDSRLRRYARKITIAASLVGATSLASIFAIEEFKTGEAGGKLKNWFTSMKSDSNDFKFDPTTITPAKPSVALETPRSTSQEIITEKNGEGARPYRQSIFHPEQEQPNVPQPDTVSNESRDGGDRPTADESTKVQKPEPILSESPRSIAQTPREAFNTPSEQDRIANMSVQERAAFEATYNTTPRSPTPEEVAEVQKLFAEKIEKLPKPTALDLQSGRRLEELFLTTNVPPHAWERVSRVPVGAFILNAMERGTIEQQTPALVQLGRIFNEVTKPPYNVVMHPNDPTEIFAHQAFTSITQAHSRGLSTDTMREYLGSIRGIGQK